MKPIALHPVSIRELSSRLHQGDVTPSDLTQSALDAAAAGFRSRAFIWRDDSGAKARAAELATAGSGGPLWGLPVSVKDLFDVAGLPTTCGSPFYAGTRPTPALDSGYVARWRAAGAVFTGKTALNEFAYGITGENRCFGDCTQPGRPDRLTGGSSSGAAASVLMGAAVIGLGTDTGGSLRVPAALCGLVSYRASLGFADWSGSFPLAHAFDTLGWLQRFLGDFPFVLDSLHPEIRSKRLDRLARVAVMKGDWLAPVEPEVIAAMDRFADTLEKAGAPVERIEAAGWEKAVDLFVPIQAHEAHGIHKPYLPTHSGAYDPAILGRLETGRGVSRERYSELIGARDAFAQGVQKLFDSFDILVAPASAMRVLHAGIDHSGTRPRLIKITSPASLAGLPVLTIPWLEGGDPGIGFQCMAARGSDGHLMSFARWLSAALAAFDAPVPIGLEL
jgi:aspartyl-tRNA(Asn)/glutamyl-tRNA(Gln) amidotransferase subunit A